MRLMFINYVCLPLPPVRGGAVENLIDMFVKENEYTHKHDITVFSIYDSKASYEAERYKYCKFEYIEIKSIFDKAGRIIRHLINRLPKVYVGNAYIAKVIRRIKKNVSEYDAVIVENAPEFGLPLYRAAKGKLVLHLHNDFLSKDTKLARKIFDSYEKIFTISDYIKSRVETVSVSNKVQTLYNGADTAKFNKALYDAQAVRGLYDIKDDDTVILYSGRLVREKGVKELITAFTLLPKKENVKLVIAGSAKYGSTVEDSFLCELEELAKSENVVFTGYVDYKDMPKIYSVADIGVVPSLCNEAFNLTVIEFMASAVPVIVSDRGALNEIVDKSFGIVVKSGNSFVRELVNRLNFLIRNKDIRIEMGEAAFKRAKNFDKQIYCDRFNYLLSEFGGAINGCEKECVF